VRQVHIDIALSQYLVPSYTEASFGIYLEKWLGQGTRRIRGILVFSVTKGTG
jgi:hypothetical protein